MFMQEKHLPITGFTPMICDAQGLPTGHLVQISKNWHQRPERSPAARRHLVSRLPVVARAGEVNTGFHLADGLCALWRCLCGVPCAVEFDRLGAQSILGSGRGGEFW